MDSKLLPLRETRIELKLERDVANDGLYDYGVQEVRVIVRKRRRRGVLPSSLALTRPLYFPQVLAHVMDFFNFDRRFENAIIFIGP